MPKSNKPEADKPIGVAVEKALHVRALAAGKLRGMKAPEVYTEALNLWMSYIAGKVDTPFGAVSHEEKRYLELLLKYLRVGGERSLLVAALEDFAQGRVR